MVTKALRAYGVKCVKIESRPLGGFVGMSLIASLSLF